MEKEWNDEAYCMFKAAYMSQFRALVPADTACQEMKDAFNNALVDFYEEG